MTQQNRLPVPVWLRQMIRQAKQHDNGSLHRHTAEQVEHHQLHTVCQGARCPNQGSCFSHGTATFLILGNSCTRNCAFCAVDHGIPAAIDVDEPCRVKAAAGNMGLKHVVVTAVTRDDLPDGGADHFAAVIAELRTLPQPPAVEVLTSDFQGNVQAIAAVLAAEPEIFAHNVEMVPRLYAAVRPGAEYSRSLAVLNYAASHARAGTVIKTGFMVGLGEEQQEIRQLLSDLRTAGVEMVTIGQYLAPTMRHYPVQRYVTQDEFNELAQEAKQMGFASVASGPLVRSSYHAGEFYEQVVPRQI
jgi:lipoic acid synthetase